MSVLKADNARRKSKLDPITTFEINETNPVLGPRIPPSYYSWRFDEAYQT